MIAPLLRRATHAAFGLALAYAVFAVFALNIDTADHRDETLPTLAGFAGAGPLLLMLWLARARLGALLRAAMARLAAIGAARGFAAALLLGLALRIAWALLVPPVPVSDGASYLALARRLASGAPYEAAGTRAYWPPGLPLALAGWILVLGDRWFVPLLHNLLLFGLTLAATRRLARRLAGQAAVLPALLCLALWPNHVIDAGLPSKELQVLALATLACALYPATPARGRDALPAGLALGAATLTQPALLLAPSAFLAWEVLRAAPWRRAALRLCLLLLGFAAAIAPWTARNYAIFERFVPVTSTGGFALYIANHDQAWGGWVDIARAGDPALDQRRDELGASREAGRRAWAWIHAHPGRFAALTARRQQLFLGDDAAAAFNALKRGWGIAGPTYAAAKLVSLGFWLGLVAALLATLAAAWHARRGRLPVFGALPILLFFYLFSLHSLVESGGRHHTALGGGLAALLGAWAAIAARRRAR